MRSDRDPDLRGDPGERVAGLDHVGLRRLLRLLRPAPVGGSRSGLLVVAARRTDRARDHDEERERRAGAPPGRRGCARSSDRCSPALLAFVVLLSIRRPVAVAVRFEGRRWYALSGPRQAPQLRPQALLPRPRDRRRRRSSVRRARGSTPGAIAQRRRRGRRGVAALGADARDQEHRRAASAPGAARGARARWRRRPRPSRTARTPPPGDRPARRPAPRSARAGARRALGRSRRSAAPGFEVRTRAKSPPPASSAAATSGSSASPPSSGFAVAASAPSPGAWRRTAPRRRPRRSPARRRACRRRRPAGPPPGPPRPTSASAS